MSVDPTQGRRGNEQYIQASCSLGPFELGVECRVVECGPNNPEVFKSKCKLKGPFAPPLHNGVFDLDLGCSGTSGVCFPL